MPAIDTCEGTFLWHHDKPTVVISMKTKPNIMDWNRLNLASSLNVFRVHTTGLEIVQLEPFCRHWERDKKTIRLIRPTHISTKHLLSVLIKRLLNSKLLSGISDSNTQHQAKFLTFLSSSSCTKLNHDIIGKVHSRVSPRPARF
jgi:hypothetical protein